MAAQTTRRNSLSFLLLRIYDLLHCLPCEAIATRSWNFTQFNLQHRHQHRSWWMRYCSKLLDARKAPNLPQTSAMVARMAMGTSRTPARHTAVVSSARSPIGLSTRKPAINSRITSVCTEPPSCSKAYDSCCGRERAILW
jgi:hypothetical protein